MYVCLYIHMYMYVTCINSCPLTINLSPIAHAPSFGLYSFIFWSWLILMLTGSFWSLIGSRDFDPALNYFFCRTFHIFPLFVVIINGGHPLPQWETQLWSGTPHQFLGLPVKFTRVLRSGCGSPCKIGRAHV